MTNDYIFLENGGKVCFESIPSLAEKDFRESCLRSIKDENCRISSFFALPSNENHILVAILADRIQHGFRVLKSTVSQNYRALTPFYAGFNRFERDIFESTGLYPAGHPCLKPLRFPEEKIGEMDFYRMEGKEVHEVAVGPVHAGVIEPGHFRFECMGETVYSLEISLGYQHRGVEKLLINAPDKRRIHLVETAAGDTSAASAWNYCRIMESLCGIDVDTSSLKLRNIALELERCANHIGDLGALAGDVAFLPTASFCGRIRGDYLNMSAELCGNRFGRNFITPGGCRYSLEAGRAEKIVKKLRTVSAELWNALDLMFNSPTVLDRFENTGTVDKNTAWELGLVGVAARASGIEIDSRSDLPCPGCAGAEPVNDTACCGDVHSRAKIRYLELKRSHEYLFETLRSIKEDIPAAKPAAVNPPAPGMLAVSVTEAWRGELCHAAVTDENGNFRIYKITDPSIHNWEGLAMALRGGEISDFPICNKSFNLSYCGHDL